MPQFHTLTVKSVEPETDDSVAVVFDVPPQLTGAFRFTQGQHIVVRKELAGQELRRTYSICAGVDDNVLRIAVKRLPGGAFSAFANDDLKAGAQLEVMPPVGHFFTVLDAANRKTYVAFASGPGITPILSIIKTTLAHEPYSRFVLFYGNGTVNNVMFREEIEDLKNLHMSRFSVFHILSREEQDVAMLNGRLNGAKAKELMTAFAPPDVVDEVFICCPQDATQEIIGTLTAMGVDKKHIHFELFHTEATAAPKARPEPAAAKANTAQVALILNGRKTEFDMPLDGRTTVLEVARDRDIDAPFSCKDGVCGTCRAKLMDGKVDMAVNYALEDDEVAAGFILTCQARPLTARIVIDYDQT